MGRRNRRRRIASRDRLRWRGLGDGNTRFPVSYRAVGLDGLLWPRTPAADACPDGNPFAVSPYSVSYAPGSYSDSLSYTFSDTANHLYL